MATAITASEERVRIFTPFGVAFVDAAMGTRVTEGLRVAASPEGDPTSVSTAFRTASGVYAFAGLPGMRAVEYPSGDDHPLTFPKQRFVFRVEDTRRRYLPTVFSVELPHPGLYPAVESGLPGFYLFPAATHPVGPALATVRAKIETPDGRSSAHAVLEVWLGDGSLHYGLADARGMATVLFPWPAFDPPPLRSLPAVVAEQEWPVRIRVRYQPSAHVHVSGWQEPTLGSVIAQGYASLNVANDDSQPTALESLHAILIHGRELVLRSGDRNPLQVIAAAAVPPSNP